MSRSATDRTVLASTIEDGTTTVVDPERGRIFGHPGETTEALGRQERAVAAEALDLIAARPDLARPVGVGLAAAQRDLLDYIRAFRAAQGTF